MEKMEIYRFRDFYIRENMMESIKAYVKEGRPVGNFLQAVICNDLKEAVGRADDENLQNIPAFVAYFYNETPMACWGSRERMRDWLDGKQKEKEDGLGMDR